MTVTKEYIESFIDEAESLWETHSEILRILKRYHNHFPEKLKESAQRLEYVFFDVIQEYDSFIEDMKKQLYKEQKTETFINQTTI